MERYFSLVKNNFGNTLRKIRQNKNITQNQVATNVTDQSTIGKIERTQIQPSYLKVTQLAYNLDCGLPELLFLSADGRLDHKTKAFSYIRRCQSKKDLAIAREGLKFCEDRYIQTNDFYFFAFKTCFRLWILFTETQNSIVPEELTLDVQQMWRQIIDMEQWYLTELYFISMIILVLPFNQRNRIGEMALDIVHSYQGIQHAEFIRNQLLESMLMIAIKSRQFAEAQHYCELLLNESIYPLTESMHGLVTFIHGLLYMHFDDEAAKFTIQKGLVLCYFADEYSIETLNRFAELIIEENALTKLADFEVSIKHLIK
ncbi:helix-turn-helix domain-containing protein [Culicoidibacter larvae]|uniref:Helix-turn-helix transcriptional regulator n=1 Tax=Culicoidibacter larvae TaxID=2579976 RepID=A0A5R8QDR9_9FIRM|nr:helix-turn-helix transcriptional regulator [Culicoidibacter larvae]TLG75371.1 helix-turn-helix transcriptional regulator [Culicoidibacter larvae]